MGVPAFFRWLSRKYPSIVVHATEERARQLEDGTEVPVDATLPNPNGTEFDNLYLDMNGIIHPCCHPEDRPAPTNEEEMMVLIFEYIDRIFRLVRPRRLLYMAIDGVAPRAKMNQQRSRRFRSSKEVGDKEEEIRKAKQKLIDEGLELPDPPKKPAEKFDSNVITPGTEFMANLAENLRYYIHDRLTNDPAWANISVILSDANVPGEGEHKIMDFIRKQRSNPEHDPNTHHCLAGADADLIMLGLATHEPQFTIIREEFKPNAPRPCELCGQAGHDLSSCRGKTQQPETDEEPPPPAPAVEFIFLRLCVLREYLEKELQPDRPLSYKFDLERAIDDWVFMCFFVGNDFLPHLPSLEIREGAIDRLIDLYKRNSDRSGGYLTENGFVNLQRAQTILYELGKMEDGILKNRMFRTKSDRKRDKERERQKRKRDEEFGTPPAKRRSTHDAPAYHLTGAFASVAVGRSVPDEYAGTPMAASRQAIHDARVQANQYSTASAGNGGNNANLTSAQKLRAMLIAPADESPKVVTVPESPPGGNRNANGNNGNRNGNGRYNGGPSRSNSQMDEEEDDPNDIVRLGEEGWKERYYMNKFGVSIGEDMRFQRELVRSYVEGLCWVLQYYYQGCPSWTWYYPYHYSPFASDFTDIGNLNITFPKDTQPFKPLEQLMGVFPAASGTFLPEKWRKIMTDTDSPILDFYPTDFCVDLNGKKFAWQGVALLPFVDEDRLLRALADVYDTLTPQEAARNSRGHNLLFLAKSHKSFTFLLDKFYKVELEVTQEETLIVQSITVEFQPMKPPLIYGMAGLVSKDKSCHRPNHPVEPPYQSLPVIQVNKALSVLYRDLEYPEDHKFPATKLPGAKAPLKVLGEGRGAQTGFDPNRPRMSLDQAGHRMLNGAVGGSRGGGRGGGGYDSRGRGGYYSQQRPHDDRRGYNEERYNDDRGYSDHQDRRGGYQGGGNRGGYDSGNRNYYDGGQSGGYQGQRHSYGGHTGGSSSSQVASYGRNSDGYQRQGYSGYQPPGSLPHYSNYDPRGGQQGRFPPGRDDRGPRQNDRGSGAPPQYYTADYRRPQ